MARKAFFILTALAVVLSGLALHAQQADPAKAKELYNQATDLCSRDNSGPAISSAIATLEQASRLDPKNELVWADLAYYYWFWGDRLPKKTPQEKKVRMQWFEKGRNAAQKALQLNPNNVEAVFFQATNKASYGEMVSIWKSVILFPETLDAMEKVDKLDPNFDQGATDRFWAEVLTRIPELMAKSVGHSKKDGIADLESDIKKWPDKLSNYVYLARLERDIGEKQKAFDNLRKAISADPAADKSAAGENRYEQEVARELWKKWTGKNYPNR
jgi:tetratricopeptide (TPR) repeat protein